MIKRLTVFLVTFLVLAVFISCGTRRNATLTKMEELEQKVYKDADIPEQKIEELKASVKKYEDIVDQKVEDTGQLGVYYKMLAVKYMDSAMYGPALDALEKAIRIYPENPVLYYLGGVMSARFAKAMTASGERERYLALAENYYQHSISLDSTYVDSLYGLSVIYAFELNTPAQAEPLLKRILLKERKNFDAMFLLARVYLAEGRNDNALDIYDKIIGSAESEKYLDQAKINRSAVAGGEYAF